MLFVIKALEHVTGITYPLYEYDRANGKITKIELTEELVAAKKELFNLRFQNATNQLDNTSRIKEVRRNIARIQTVIAEGQASAE